MAPRMQVAIEEVARLAFGARLGPDPDASSPLPWRIGPELSRRHDRLCAWWGFGSLPRWRWLLSMAARRQSIKARFE